MIIKDLKKELENYSDDAEVVIKSYVGISDENYFGDAQKLDIEEISKDQENSKVVCILVG